MVQITQPNRNREDKEALLANIALLYYGEGLTQSEIAKRMQVSRATIVNLLRESRERGIVEIRVDGKHLSSSNLARDLRDKFGLQDVYIATADNRDSVQDRAGLLAHVSRVGAAAFLDIVAPGDRVGVAWGETIMAVSDVMAPSSTERVQVCQLIGSMNSVRVPTSENCAIQIAGKIGAECYTLHAPGVVASPELAEVFRNEPTIREQLSRLDDLDMIVASVGNVSPDTHLKVAGMATTQELQAARKLGAKGIICCRFIDADGQGIETAPDDRVIAANLANLRKPKKKLLVVCGANRTEATLASLRGDLVTHLCVDQVLAMELLQSAP
ncbi:sugar-binding transcriptional regulator [uncultured Tateyamaria sp.]|uniref:sugar-binding transcriptional regulator n=1 Tax=uncultured Tateyamaria sp. TaxID=455651 RepID=UPI00260D0776|nr:sugar-binding transcriptional regulator [uncultured Tateyamaria sp.]